MFASKSERKVRYSIRKFSVGVASVVVASLFLGGVVHAEGVGGTSQGIPLKATDKDELYEKAVKEVNIEISKHMSNRLDQLDRQSSGFTEILKKIQGVVEGYRKQIDEALSKDGVEKLGEEAKKKIDELVEAFQNNSDNQIPPKKPSQNDGVQGDAPSAGQGEQPGASNSGDSKPVPPETSGETKPKTSNDSENSLERELKEAKETAKTTLDNYMLTRLKQENPGVFWFTDLLRESKESVEKYKRMFDEASSKEKVETLVKEAEQEIEALVVKHKGREIGLERDKAKEAVTKHLAKLLNDIKENLEKEQHINTVELIKKLEDIKQTYLHKLDGLTQTDQLQELVIESQSKLDEALSNFKKGLSSSSNSGSSTKPETPEKSEQPAPSKPAENDTNSSDSSVGKETLPSPSLKPGKKVAEAEEKKLQDLIHQGQEELEKLEAYLREVNHYPELPDNDSDYKVQKKDIWNDSKDTAPKKIKVFKEQVRNKTYTEKSLKDAVDDFIYYQIHAQIEIMTRKIAIYRKKHPNVAEVERLFSEKLKQTANSTYATLEGQALKKYFERDFLPFFNKIQNIVEELEKKSNQEVPQKQDKVAEAQKKVAEAEKKAQAQKEEDRRNYPTNTSKTIELEIAEAKVEVAKAELELVQAESQTPQDTDKINTAKAKVETAKSKVETLEKIKSGHGRPQAGDQKPSMPAPDTKPDLQPQPEVPRPSAEPKPIPQPDGKQPSTPKEPENKKPSLPSPEKPKNSKIFTATDGKTKVTVMFEHSVDVGKVNIKEVISKDLVATITHKAGGGVVRVFELFLSKNGKETHVNGERTVRLTLGQTGSGVQVYHVKENGELELLPSTVENGQVVFKTSHFSLFAIKTLPKKQMATEPEENREGKTQSDDKKRALLANQANQMSENHSNSDEKGKQLPSTGTMSTLFMEFLGLISLVGVYLLKGKKTEND